MLALILNALLKFESRMSYVGQFILKVIQSDKKNEQTNHDIPITIII